MTAEVNALRSRRELPLPSREAAFSVLTPLALLMLWEICARIGLLDQRILAAPSLVLQTLWEMAADGELWPHIGYTVGRFVIGTCIGIVPGIFLGLTMGLFPWCRAIVQPIITVLYPLPRIALFPLFLILVGLNETANVLMIAVGPFFTMVIATMAGVMNIDPIFRDVATSFDTRTKDLYLRVTLPAALPVIMSGVQISLGLGLMTTTAVEYLNADIGLGYLIWHSWQILSLRLSLASLLAAGVIGAIFYNGFQWIERKLIPWQIAHGR
jgi:ABC-type nitrate/sulfonate/bicarbonate transport system permease component